MRYLKYFEFSKYKLTFEDILNKLVFMIDYDYEFSKIRRKNEFEKLDIIVVIDNGVKVKYVSKEKNNMINLIESYFKWKTGKDFDIYQIYTTFFFKEESYDIKKDNIVLSIGVVGIPANSFQQISIPIKTEKDKEEFIDFINNPDMFLKIDKYNL